MGKFSGMLLVSDFDNTFQYTESALESDGMEALPPLPARNLEAVDRWISGRYITKIPSCYPFC